MDWGTIARWEWAILFLVLIGWAVWEYIAASRTDERDDDPPADRRP